MYQNQAFRREDIKIKHLRREELSKAMIRIHSLANNHFNLFKLFTKKVINQTKHLILTHAFHQTRYKHTLFQQSHMHNKNKTHSL